MHTPLVFDGHNDLLTRLDDALHSLQAGEPPDLRRTMAEARNSGQVVVPLASPSVFSARGLIQSVTPSSLP